MNEQNQSNVSPSATPVPSAPAVMTRPAGLKKDLIISAIIGLLSAALMLPILKNLDYDFPMMEGLLIILPVLCAAGMWTAYWLAQKIKIMLQIARFVLVGALNTFVDWGVLNVLIFLTGITSGWGYSAFKGTSFVVAAVNSYFWNKLWTFKKIDQVEHKASGKEFMQFFVVSIIGFALNVSTATLIVNVWGTNLDISSGQLANFGALAGTLLGLVWNFLGYKLIVFKD